MSAQLPVEVAAADEDVRVALGALGVEDTAANRERVLDARGVFLDVAAAHLRHMSAVPRELRTPSWRQLYVDMLAAFVANVVGFAVPTALGQLGRSRQAQTWIYSGAVAALGVVGPQVSSLVKRWGGGANARWRLSLGNSANVGPYKEIVGELGLALGNLALYAATHAGVSATGGVWSTPGGQIGRALLSGAVMSVAGQGITNAAAGWTLSRSGVVRADRLAETARNRTIPDGVYMVGVTAWHERTTAVNKALELAAQTVGMVIGAVVMDVVMEHGDEAMHPAARSAWNFLLGVSALLVISALVRALYTFVGNDPARHANKFGIAASDVMTATIEASAMHRFEEVLDKVGVDIVSGHWGPQGAGVAGTFGGDVDVFSGAVFRQRPLRLDATLDPLVGRLGELAGRLRSERDEALLLPVEGTLVKMADTLQAAVVSLQAAGRAAGAGEDFSPELKDARLRIRDLQALLVQHMFQLGGVGPARGYRRVTQMAAQLLALFAALRQADRMELADAFITGVVEYASGRRTAKAALAGLGPDAHNRVKAGDVAAKLKSIGRAGPDPGVFLGAAADLFGDLFAGKVPGYAASKLLMLANLVNKPDTAPAPDASGHAAAGDVAAAVAALTPFEVLPTAGADRVRQTFITGLRNHTFSLLALRDAIDELRDAANSGHGGDDIELGHLIGAGRAGRILNNFDKMLGASFVAALAAETPSRLTDADTIQGTVDTSVGDLLQSLWDDTANIPRSHGMLARSALSLPLPPTPVDLPTRRLADAHFHPTNYAGKINSLVRLIGYMDAAGIQRSNLAGIPSQVWRHTNERKYYANSTNNIAYRDHDFALAAQYVKLTPEQRQRVDLTITGIDVTNGPAIGQELDIRLRAHPRVFVGVGEVTLIKEIVSDKNPHRPDIGGVDTQTLLIEATKRGLPVILHNDRGVPGGKNKHAGQMVAAIREWAERMTRFGNEQDPLMRPGVDPATVPAMNPRLIWAHAAGMSRFTGESNHHTRDLDELLSDPTLADIVHLDLSWDFVVNDIMQNLYDQLTRHNVAPGLRQGLQNVLKFYKSFTVLGGLADKADDLGDVNLASLYRVGAETITKQYVAALADFQRRVRQAFNDPATRAVFTDLLAEHGQRGNNWLYIMRKHSDRLMFGTDALAVGIKAHGEAAYAMNARIMYPLFDILDQAAAHHLPDTAGVTDKISRTNYEKIFHDPQITARRHAWEDYLAAEKTAEHSAQVQPQQFTTSHAAGEPATGHGPVSGGLMAPAPAAVVAGPVAAGVVSVGVVAAAEAAEERARALAELGQVEGLFTVGVRGVADGVGRAAGEDVRGWVGLVGAAADGVVGGLAEAWLVHRAVVDGGCGGGGGGGSGAGVDGGGGCFGGGCSVAVAASVLVGVGCCGGGGAGAGGGGVGAGAGG